MKREFSNEKSIVESEAYWSATTKKGIAVSFVGKNITCDGTHKEGQTPNNHLMCIYLFWKVCRETEASQKSSTSRSPISSTLL